MTTILSPPALPPQAQLGQAALAAVLLTQLPSELRQLVAGALLSGIVVGRDARGQTLLRTDAGIVTLRTPAPPPVGSAVMLEVQAVGTQVQAVILSITPSPPRTGTAAPGTPAPAQPPPAAAAQPQVPGHAPAAPGTISVAPGITTAPTLTAFVIAPSANPSTTVAAAPTAPSTGSPATVFPSPQTQPGQAPITASATPTLSPPASPPAAADPSNTGPLLVTSVTAETSGPAGAAPTSPSTTTPSAPSLAGPPANEAPTRVAVAQADLAYRTAAGSAPLPPPSPASDAAVPPAPRPLAAAGAAAAPSLNPQGAAEIIARGDGPSPAPSGTAPVVPTKPLPVGTQVQLRLISTEAGMPNAPIPPPASSAPGETAIIPATVVGRVASGLTVVDTPLGRLAVPLSNAMPQVEPGARLWFATTGAGSPPTGLAMANPPAVLRASQAALAHDWPALKATLATLSDATQPTVRQLIEQALPRPGPRLAVQILSYIANGAAPDAHALLGGPALNVLERAGRGDLIARLDTDLAEMTKLSAASASEWRVAFVPICAGDMIHQLRVFTRRRRASTPRRDDAGKRFVVECDFTEFGPVQLDGLLNKPSLDLILRTHDDLPQSVQSDLGRLFAGSCSAAGLSGRLAFQSATTFPVSPLDEILGAGSALLV
ncbi:MAG: hypothetical protein HY246_19830 [Proteobacteria bacterium]|nr:hypothetical protein [Pseudomonadota bacterium]